MQHKRSDAPDNPCVYFIAGADLIKIGIANNLKKRLIELQCGSPIKLRVLGFVATPQPELLEKWLHGRFDEYRRHGEWFESAYELQAIATGEHPEFFQTLSQGDVADRCGIHSDFIRESASHIVTGKATRQGYSTWYRQDIEDLAELINHEIARVEARRMLRAALDHVQESAVAHATKLESAHGARPRKLRAS